MSCKLTVCNKKRLLTKTSPFNTLDWFIRRKSNERIPRTFTKEIGSLRFYNTCMRSIEISKLGKLVVLIREEVESFQNKIMY